MKTLTTFCALLLVAASCTEFDVTPEYKIDSALVPYVNSFIMEASLRGVKLDKQNLRMLLDDSNDHGVDAFKPGTFFPGTQRTILIDAWTFNLQSKSENEVLTFHELGHALLGLKHDDSHECLMNSGPSIYAFDEVDNRTRLLDELFKANRVR